MICNVDNIFFYILCYLTANECLGRDGKVIYQENQLIEMILKEKDKSETEIIEFKEAKSDYNFSDIGKYFSALSNEANLRDREEAWLVFGIKNNGSIVGSAYRNNGNLQNLKKEIVNNTNERMTFIEIYELFIEGKRVVAFQIPRAISGIPTTYNGAAYSREHESLAPLPMNKLDLIRSQRGYDWSKEIIPEATIEDLDEEAVKKARELFYKKQSKSDSKFSNVLFDEMSDMDVLNKAGITIRGKITNTALLLLGKSESSHMFNGFKPRITWTLYNSDNSVKTYQHFDTPFLLAVDKVYQKLRNEKYRYISGQISLFPDEVNQYEPEILREAINNCIAHSDYRLRGKINVEEFEDRIVFINEASFIPETIENAIETGYKPPYYRNAFLCEAMVNMTMIDTNSIGITKMFQIQKQKCFPLPSYDLDVPNRVKVTIYGKILDPKYTQLLHSNMQLDLNTVFSLDKIQKNQKISKDEYLRLKKLGLAEGRYPNIFVSYKVAKVVGSETDYAKNKGLNNEVYIQMIMNTLDNMREASKEELYDVMQDVLPRNLDNERKKKKLSNMLQKMKNDGLIKSVGGRRHAKWIKIQ